MNVLLATLNDSLAEARDTGMITALAATLGLAFRGRPVAYHRDPGCHALDINVAQVEDLLQERTELRRARDFGSADRVLENLREMGVAVDDDARSWFVGGSRKWQRPDGNRREQAARHSREQVQKDARARRKTPKKPAKAKGSQQTKPGEPPKEECKQQ